MAEREGTVKPPNKVFRCGETSPIDIKRIEKWLTDAEDRVSMASFIMTVPPVMPRRGEVFLYRCKNKSDTDYNKDLYFGFISRGDNKKTNANVIKKYYVMTTPSGDKCEFFKDIYILRKSLKDEHKIVAIHYRGDHSLWEPRPHKNDTKGRNFTPNMKASKEKIAELLKVTGKKPKATYIDALQQASTGSDFKDREAVAGPRDTKQVSNVKYKLDTDLRLMRCEIFSVIEMGRNKILGRFFHKFVTNRFEALILCHPETIVFANKLLHEATLHPELPQLLGYDTTFNLGDTYCSTLVMRNTYAIGDPIFPVAYMLHERKFKAVHMEFWWEISQLLNLKELGMNVPICTDREEGVVQAIKALIPDVNLVLCVNHIIQDVQRWIKSAEGSNKDDLTILTNHIHAIIECKTETDFNSTVEEKQQFWSQSFKTYFNQNLLHDIAKHSAAFYTSRFPAFDCKTATNNISESMNAVIKEFNDWNELRFDSLALALFNHGLGYLQDYSRSFSEKGLENKVLKEMYRGRSPPYALPQYTYWTQQQLMDAFKDGVVNPKTNVEKEGQYLQCRQALARLTCAENLVSLDSKSATFIVTGIYDRGKYMVTPKQDKTLSCTCTSTGYCHHSLAVLYSTNSEVTDDPHTYSLSLLRRKTRGYKGRTGKKQPKKGDYEMDINPAPDSDLQMRKEALEGDLEIDDFLNGIIGNEKSQSDGKGEKTLLKVTFSPSVIPPQSLDPKREPYYDNADQDLIHAAVREKYDELGMHHYDDSNVQDSQEGASNKSFLSTLPAIFDLNADLPLLPAFYYNHSYGSILKGSRYLSGDIVNDMCAALIQSHELEDQVVFVNCFEMLSMMQKDYRRRLSYIWRVEPLNSELVVMVINKNVHWLLGVIIWKTRDLVILDSFRGYLGSYDEIFRGMLAYAAASHYVSGAPFNSNEWKFVIDTLVPQQQNDYDCGVIVCQNLYAIVRRTRYVHGNIVYNSALGRRWIMQCLYDYELPVKLRGVKNRAKFPPDLVEAILTKLQELDGVSVNYIQEPRNEIITTQLRGLNRGLDTCHFEFCSGTAPEDVKLLLCVVCRGWFHDTCVEAVGFADSYFFCSICSPGKVNLVS